MVRTALGAREAIDLRFRQQSQRCSDAVGNEGGRARTGTNSTEKKTSVSPCLCGFVIGEWRSTYGWGKPLLPRVRALVADRFELRVFVPLGPAARVREIATELIRQTEVDGHAAQIPV